MKYATMREIREADTALFNVLEAFLIDYNRDDMSIETEYNIFLDTSYIAQVTDSVFHFACIESGITHEQFDFTFYKDIERKEYIFSVFNNTFAANNYVMFIDSNTLKYKRSIDSAVFEFNTNVLPYNE